MSDSKDSDMADAQADRNFCKAIAYMPFCFVVFSVIIHLICGIMYVCSHLNCACIVFSSPVQSTGRAIVLTLALALTLALPFPSRHF